MLRWNGNKYSNIGTGGRRHWKIRAPGRESEVDDKRARRTGGGKWSGEISPLGSARQSELVSGPAGRDVGAGRRPSGAPVVPLVVADGTLGLDMLGAREGSGDGTHAHVTAGDASEAQGVPNYDLGDRFPEESW